MAELAYRKANDRYYVEIDGVKVGWVLKIGSQWAFYATVHDALKGTQLAAGFSTRRDAVMQGLSSLQIRHLGRIAVLNLETIKDEYVSIPEADLKDLWNQLMNEKYPLTKEAP
jgi:hypothetical protein